jgi:hypothetical protein
LIDCCEKEKLFVVKTITNNTQFQTGYSTTWKCLDCDKEIKKQIFKGDSGWKSVKLFLKRETHV